MTITTLHPSDWALNIRTHPTRNTTLRLSNFVTHYRVEVADIGEDGDLIALGHVGKFRALAAFNRHAREVWGMRAQGDVAAMFECSRQPVGVITDGLEHVWMVNDGNAEDWNLRRVQARTISGAFPVTYWTN